MYSCSIAITRLRRLTMTALSALILMAFILLASATSAHPEILLFNGTGTIANDVKAVEAVLSSLGVSYATADSAQLDDMSESELRSYKLLIVPGGNSITIGENLKTSTTENVHNAVRAGLHYLGICAGGFFGGYSYYNGLNLTSGVWFDFYADHYKGINKAAVEVRGSKGDSLDQYWQDGPEFSGWGSIVGEYSNGTPAIVEGKSGNGWVILSGVHPEAPANWRYGMKFTTSVQTDNAYAGVLILAALNGTSLPHY
ncbi:MAG: BPL-N domain-containing protein [Candidatus Sulfotelmatobacter sp.]